MEGSKQDFGFPWFKARTTKGLVMTRFFVFVFLMGLFSACSDEAKDLPSDTLSVDASISVGCQVYADCEAA